MTGTILHREGLGCVTGGKKAKAHHEAGHAVVARVLGVTVDHASLLVDVATKSIIYALTDSALYRARSKPLSEQIAAAEIDAKVALAGPLAQCRYRPLTEGQKRKAQEQGWYDDMVNIKSFIGQILYLQQGGEIVDEERTVTIDIDANAFNATWRRLNNEAQNLVDQNWQAISRVAAALLERRLLYQDDIDALMRD